MILMIDNYDSFTYNLVRYFEQLGEEIKVVSNDSITIDEIVELNPKAIVLSPGPKRPEDAKICLDIVENLSGKFPILGICLGHQVIAIKSGMEVICGEYPIHGVVSEITHNSNDKLLFNIPNTFKATRYHSLVACGESSEIEVLASANSGEIMIIKRCDSNTYGIQYHPESFLTEYGYQILKNFISICEEQNG